MSASSRNPIPVAGELLRRSCRMLRAGGTRLLGLILLTQLLIAAVAAPLIGWLFSEALRAAGMTGLDLGRLRWSSGIPLTIGLLLVICVLSLWLVSLQFTAIVVLLESAALERRIGVREWLSRLRGIARKLLRPSSLPLLGYLLLVLPLSGFGFASALTQHISIPRFVSGELLKSVTGQVVLAAVLIGVGVLNIRWSLTVPVFALTDASGGAALRRSRRLTRGLRPLPLIIAVAAALLVVLLLAAALFAVALVPTIVSDRIAPAASPVVAAYSLGIAEVLGGVLAGIGIAAIVGLLIAELRRQDPRPDAVPEPETEPEPGRRARPRLLVIALASALALALGTASIPTMQELSERPDTLALAHRGFTPEGVENTIGALEAAAAQGVDLVEMDVMQTADGGFIAMHDMNLGRLTDQNLDVKDLTLAELTAMTVHDLNGHEDSIPSLADYARRAEELDVTLLIEIKLSGGDTPDHVDRLVAELETLGVLERNIYHSLDAPSVSRLKQLRPDLTVGYTMLFGAVEAPDTPADFIVVEQWTAGEALQRSAERKGLGFMVWTVDEPADMREYLRRQVSGLISDRPDLVLQERSEIADERGLSGTLLDALQRFVTVV